MAKGQKRSNKEIRKPKANAGKKGQCRGTLGTRTRPQGRLIVARRSGRRRRLTARSYCPLGQPRTGRDPPFLPWTVR